MSQNCISLAGSSQCSAFNASSISASSQMVGLFPFLSGVTSTATFDQALASWVSGGYVQSKYQTLLGCGGINLANTTSLYARYTTSTICNAVVQNSITPCSLSAANSLPLCADSCALFAESEAAIAEDSQLCSNPSASSQTQIRADFTNCALPARSLSNGMCVAASSNEPDNCGYSNNLVGLCSLCAAGGVNSTDTCCYNSQAQSRCVGVVLPTITASVSLATSTMAATSTPATASPSASSAVAAAASSPGLSGGAIAGIVIGSIAALALLIGLIFLILLCCRRRRGSQNGSVFNQPTPARQSTGMRYSPTSPPAVPDGYEVLPGGRIARMSALEGHSGDSSYRNEMTAVGAGLAGVGAGAGAAYGAGRRKDAAHVPSSDEHGDSPESNGRGGVLGAPATGRRGGSLSSASALAMDSSPPSGSGGEMSSPHGLSSQQSEQLPFFKDYYSQEDIHPGDKVATLWAYQPRAGDEFALERGDMLKIVGIWDDGWATGIIASERAEEWEARHNAQRDSGVSNGSGRVQSSPVVTGEIKAFPLVCVCLPEHWRRTIEGDNSSSSGGQPPQI